MGLLTEGHPLEWEESKKHHMHVKTHGIEQFLNLYQQRAGKVGSPLRWGDEVEYFICKLDDESRTARLPLRAPEILKQFAEDSQQDDTSISDKGIIWHPEYANWMLEATPGKPYGGNLEDFLEVERNMIARRKAIQKFLLPGEQVFTMTCFPRMGTEGFTSPSFPRHHSASRGVSNSLYIPDESINPHPRFPTLTANIRKRRGEKVSIAVPAYQDTHTAANLVRQRHQAAAALTTNTSSTSALPPLPDDAIYMDCMAFGMGAGCLQVTLQASDVTEARFLYDQLAVVAPLMMALTAATPVWKGTLADTDARWNVISAAVDDRDAAERGTGNNISPEASLGRRAIPKSRYSSIDCYISDSPLLVDHVHNDVECVVNESARRRLLQGAGGGGAGAVDERLARHVAHLFARDPLVIFDDRIELDDETETEHFENLQSTNWNTVRFKPPPAGAKNIDWRVEFRTMELSLTDYENAAHSVFVMLLTRAILDLELNLYTPISLVDANMETAHRRAAATQCRFWMRRNIRAGCSYRDHAAAAAAAAAAQQQGDDVPVEMTLGEVFNGDGRGYPGLVGVVREYLDRVGCGGDVRRRFDGYLALISDRAAGRLLTTATWIRNLILSHPDYRSDSDISDSICYDIMRAAAAVASGEDPAPELLGVAAPAAVLAGRDSAACTPTRTASDASVKSAAATAAGVAAAAAAAAAAADVADCAAAAADFAAAAADCAAAAAVSQGARQAAAAAGSAAAEPSAVADDSAAAAATTAAGAAGVVGHRGMPACRGWEWVYAGEVSAAGGDCAGRRRADGLLCRQCCAPCGC